MKNVRKILKKMSEKFCGNEKCCLTLQPQTGKDNNLSPLQEKIETASLAQLARARDL